MTLDEFRAKYLGKRVEFDGVYEYQCVDLTKMYSKEVIGTPQLMGNAIDYVNNPLPDYYEYHTNHLWYIPPRGSIAVWNGNVGGGFGHAAIVLFATLMKFTSLDQNWPTGEVVKEVEHPYSNVVGFLVPRPIDTISRYNELVDEVRKLVAKYPKV